MVPVIKDADSKNLLGLTKEINQFAEAGRNEKLQPDSLQGWNLYYYQFLVHSAIPPWERQ